MSSEIIWNIVKKNSSFMRKQKHNDNVTMFSTENLSVSNVYAPKHLGVCQKRAVGVNCEGNRIILSIKSTKNTTKPAKSVAKANVKSATSVAKEVIKGSYCPASETMAVARYNALNLAIRRAQKKYVNKKRLMGRAL